MVDMKSIKNVLFITLFSLLAGCGPSIGDAKKLGFESVEQMKTLQARGFKTMKDYLDHEESLRLAEEKAAAEKAAARREEAEKKAREAAAMEAPLTWIKKQRQLCQAYANAPNEIKKSSIFRETSALLQSASVNKAKGVLKRISTNQGGSTLFIMVSVGDEIEFATESITNPIRYGSKVYQQVENLKENSCVYFSASELTPSSVFEQSKVCDLEYFVEFTNIEPCN
jgi:hypothetical protein